MCEWNYVLSLHAMCHGVVLGGRLPRLTLGMGTGVLEDSAGVLRDFCSVAELGKLWSHRQQGKLWRPDWVAWESMLEGGGELDGGGCGSESDGELA